MLTELFTIKEYVVVFVLATVALIILGFGISAIKARCSIKGFLKVMIPILLGAVFYIVSTLILIK